nr:5-oxoprolinase subunit PxpB [Cytophagales bacterium]
MKQEWRLFWINAYVLEISWEAGISQHTLLKMIAVKSSLEKGLGADLYDVRMGYHALAVHFRQPAGNRDWNKIIQELMENAQSDFPQSRKRWRIPVCYAPEVAKDLISIANLKGMTVEELVQEHSSAEYMLYFYGFLPGFMYLGGLSERLHVPRKAIPDPQIPSGSVAIGGMQTGIYPMNSPGGWHVIGKIPFSLFDPQTGRLPVFRSGDSICFMPIKKREFDIIVHDPVYSLTYDII